MQKSDIDKLVEQSQKPLLDSWLEQFHPGHEPVPYWRFLYNYVLKYQPKVCLEIGTYHGVGSAHLAAAASTYGGIVLGVDIQSHEMTKTIIKERYGNYHFYLGDSINKGFDITLALSTQPIDLVFQDSSHHYHASHREWGYYSQMLSDNFIWICDDITESFHDPKIDPPGKSMVNYFNEIVWDDGRRPIQKFLYPDVLHKGNTIGVIIPG